MVDTATQRIKEQIRNARQAVENLKKNITDADRAGLTELAQSLRSDLQKLEQQVIRFESVYGK